MSFFKTKFKSHKQEWETPFDFFQQLNKEFNFDIDLAANVKNTKCDNYYDVEIDALTQTWNGICWLNPPYGKKEYKLSNWVKKSYQETQKSNCTVVMLIPARTNTCWWHDYCMKAAEIRLLKGRLKFVGAKYGLPQPLALVIFRQHTGRTIFSSYSGYKF